VYGFLGPNGAGKTTTFKLICALLRPSVGTIVVDGIDVRQNPRRAMKRLGVQFDSPSFYPYLTGRDNLLIVSRWLDQSIDGTRIESLLSQVGLANAANRKVGGYSWGMKQRLGLASALLSDPKLVLLDEPTNGLDPAGISDVRRLLPSLVQNEGRTVFLSSHRMEEVEQVCDHVTIINEGQIAAAGTPSELVSGKTVIEVHCDDPQSAARILKDIGEPAEVDIVSPRRLDIHTTVLDPGRINKYLVQNGVPVEQVVKRGESLEQVFFRLTARSENGPSPRESFPNE